MSAYREAADKRTILFCPRCNELLDQIDFGVDICPRCEGFWIASSVLELSGHQWPTGPQVWWRREVRCPMCATQGIATVMNARTSSDVIIDQCFAHGVWLDRGELSRVMRDPIVKGLTKLREHLGALEPSAEELVLKRERWHGEQEERARLATIERKRIETERTKRAEEAAKTEAQRTEERRQAHADKLREAERLAEARRAELARSEAARAGTEHAQAEERIAADRAAIAEAQRARTNVSVPLPSSIDRRDARASLQSWNADLPPVGVDRVDTRALEREKLALERRVDFLTARIDSLRLELSESQEGLAKARSDLAATTKRIDDAIE